MHIDRRAHLLGVKRLLRQFPVVALLGPRQVGKTTLAQDLVRTRRDGATMFDLEDPRDVARLDEPTLALERLRGLVVLDEIQRRPELFPVLRVLSDRPGKPARFLVLGSASPELLKQGAETLAGRIGFYELSGFDLLEIGAEQLERLWIRGGFPPSYLPRSQRESHEWRRVFIRTFLERDLAGLGSTLPPAAMGRFWTMLAHYHGQIWNASEFARSFGVSQPTVQKYLDLLTGAFMVEQLRPWAENVGKRVVKSPKMFLTDSGILHTLLGLATRDEVERHPKLGASWEGFTLLQVVRLLRAGYDERFFWATHAGAELDLLVVRGGRRLGFEFKRTDAPRVTASMRGAIETLRLDDLTVVHGGSSSFAMASGVRAVAAAHLLRELRQS